MSKPQICKLGQFRPANVRRSIRGLTFRSDCESFITNILGVFRVVMQERQRSIRLLSILSFKGGNM